ncbi:peritrophin-48-like [Daphnia carinata]|uniref:peritrophin-48-like n=1 Tax=Daphnia carinata TaxID=120202 RepID=UPI00257C40FE|nr:peritrophin-48-like [Daphnia carinata]
MLFNSCSHLFYKKNMVGRWVHLLLVFVVVKGFSCRVWKGLPQQFVEPSCPEEEGFFTVDNQCTREFHYCLNGDVIYEQECPELDVFDPLLKTCVDPATCFDCPPEDGVHPVPQNCTGKYYQCTSGVPEKLSCPADYIFDPVTYECTLAEQASCAARMQCSEDGFFPFPGECTALYFCCVGGESFTMYCPSDTVFDPSILTCVPIEAASCTPGPKTTTTAKLTDRTIPQPPLLLQSQPLPPLPHPNK